MLHAGNFMIGIIGVVFFAIIFYIGFSSRLDLKQALGLPKGSVRALLALLSITTFVTITLTVIVVAIFPSGIEVISTVSEARIEVLKSTPSITILSEGKLTNGYHNSVTILHDKYSHVSQYVDTLLGALIALVSALSAYYFGAKRDDNPLPIEVNKQPSSSDEAMLLLEEIDVLQTQINNAQDYLPNELKNLRSQLSLSREKVLHSKLQEAANLIDSVQEQFDALKRKGKDHA